MPQAAEKVASKRKRLRTVQSSSGRFGGLRPATCECGRPSHCLSVAVAIGTSHGRSPGGFGRAAQALALLQTPQIAFGIARVDQIFA
jgi:hypothetical protein